MNEEPVDPKVVAEVVDALRHLARETADDRLDEHDDQLVHAARAY